MDNEQPHKASTAFCFSASTMGFYPQAWIDDGTYEDTLPADIITLRNDELVYRGGMPPAGKILGSMDGRPVWVDIPPPTVEEQANAVALKKQTLINEANAVITPLKDAFDGGYIDDEDKPKLAEWQKYRYALTKVDPIKPVWPEKPAG